MESILTALFLIIGVSSLAIAETDPQTLETLRRIHAPQVVGVPPANACRGLMVMPDGEIRHYGFRHKEEGTRHDYRLVYISSRDWGLNWREVTVKEETAAAMVRSPYSGDYLTVLPKTTRDSHSTASATVLKSIEGTGTFAVRSAQGPNGPYKHVRANSRTGFTPRLPCRCCSVSAMAASWSSGTTPPRCPSWTTSSNRD